jgi:hypothetical protein
MGLDMYLSIRKYVGRLDLSAGYDEVKPRKDASYASR